MTALLIQGRVLSAVSTCMLGRRWLGWSIRPPACQRAGLLLILPWREADSASRRRAGMRLDKRSVVDCASPCLRCFCFRGTIRHRSCNTRPGVSRTHVRAASVPRESVLFQEQVVRNGLSSESESLARIFRHSSDSDLSAPRLQMHSKDDVAARRAFRATRLHVGPMNIHIFNGFCFSAVSCFSQAESTLKQTCRASFGMRFCTVWPNTHSVFQVFFPSSLGYHQQCWYKHMFLDSGRNVLDNEFLFHASSHSSK